MRSDVPPWLPAAFAGRLRCYKTTVPGLERIPLAKPSGATAEWRQIARNDDVLFSITSWPDKRGQWTERDFYASGDMDWEDFRTHWSHFDPKLGGTCVEIGCGAGRLTRPLSSFFDRVVALDVSDDMIALTRSAVGDGAELIKVEGPAIPLATGEAEAVFSCHVLQHLESHEDFRRYLAEAHRVLRPGGTMMVHITLNSRRRSLPGRAVRELQLRYSRWRLSRGKIHTAVRMRVYQPEQIFHLLSTEIGFDDVELRAFPARSNGYLHHFFLARR
jgi:ubiquinone/menaquinone biosynthesis C-methylase UbiE